jgi:hypothetical protein
MSLSFVVSTGRCGSGLLSRILRANPDVLSIEEVFGAVPAEDLLTGRLDGRGFWRRVAGAAPVVSRATLRTLTDDPGRLYDWLAAVVPRWPARPVPDHYRHLFSLLAERCGGPVIVERTGGSLRFVAGLHRAFPEARFVYLSRDGVECALSMSRRASPPAGCAGAVPLTAFGECWSSTTLEGAAELPLIPHDRWTTLRFETLLRDPAACLRRLARFLGAASPPEWLAWAAGQVEPAGIAAAAALGPGELAALREACSPGYAADEALHASHGHEP